MMYDSLKYNGYNNINNNTKNNRYINNTMYHDAIRRDINMLKSHMYNLCRLTSADKEYCDKITNGSTVINSNLISNRHNSMTTKRLTIKANGVTSCLDDTNYDRTTPLTTNSSTVSGAIVAAI